MIEADILEKIQPGTKVRVTERVLMDMSKTRTGAKLGVKSTKGAKDVKERISRFEGLVLARKHGKQPGATFTVRSTVAGVGMEKIYPINSPSISKVEILAKPKKVRKSKLYYLRDLSAKNIRRKIKATQ